MLFTFAFIFISIFHIADSEQTNLKLEVDQLRSLIEKQSEELSQQQAQIRSLLANVSNLQSAKQLRGIREQNAVAFTVYLDHAEDEFAYRIIRFNRVLYNLGGAYSTNTGYFTAPITGTYIFSFQIEHWNTPELRAQLVVHGQHQVSAIIYPNGKSTQSGNTAIIGLSAGQQVWVETIDNGHLYGSDGFRGTTFAGTLLHQ